MEKSWNCGHELLWNPVLHYMYVTYTFQNVAYESRKSLASWVNNLYSRVDFFAQWGELIINSVEKLMKPVMASKGPAPEILEDEEPARCQPDSYWLSGFFFPQGNFSAVLLLQKSSAFSSAEMFKKPLWQTVWTQIRLHL